MPAYAILLTAVLGSGIANSPQTAEPSQQFETLEEMFEAETETWIGVPMTNSAHSEVNENDAVGEFVYKPVVHETLETPPEEEWLLANPHFFGITR